MFPEFFYQILKSGEAGAVLGVTRQLDAAAENLPIICPGWASALGNIAASATSFPATSGLMHCAHRHRVRMIYLAGWYTEQT
jgi:hypothetical protein